LNSGRINRGIEVQRLKRISPSRYNSLRQCTLREVFAAQRGQSLLPNAPSSLLGTIIHQLLEDAGKGKLVLNQNDVMHRWNELVERLEKELANEALQATSVPLSKTVKEYDLKRLRAVKKALEVGSTHSRTSTAGSGHEVWVQTKDGLIGGSIDRVLFNEHGPVIRDYKSGQVFDGQDIKPDYAMQLKLYAALFSETNGLWPVALELEPLSGARISVPFSVPEAESLLVEAVEEFKQANNRISGLEGKDSLDKGISSLASPESIKCHYCRFRPKCGAYLREWSNSEDDNWSADILGMVSDIKHLSNGKLLLGISTKVGSIYLRGVTDSLTRHPALEHLKVADRVGIFNVSKTPASETFNESIQTTIYMYENEIEI
jgi:RecB family exonuclease